MSHKAPRSRRDGSLTTAKPYNPILPEGLSVEDWGFESEDAHTLV
jgi:hypothetical protein